MKKIFTFIIASILIFTLSSCQKNDVIKIGYVNSLAYNFGNLGIDSMYGTMMAVEEINKDGGINGKQVQLLMRDDERDPLKAVEVDNQLKEDGVVAIIGHGYSITAENIAENALENDIFMITPTIATERVSDIDDTFLRISPTTKEQGRSLANIAKDLEVNDVLIIYESINEAFSLDLVNTFIKEFELSGNQIDESNIISFRKNNINDYQMVKSLIESKGITNILAVGSSFDVGNIVQMLDNPTMFTFFLPAWTTTSDIFEFASTKIENSYAINFYDFENPHYQLASLMTRYEEEFGRPASYSSILAYEAVYLVKEALENASDYSAQSLKKYIIDKQKFTGIMNDYYINEYGECFRRIYHYKLEDGQFKTIGYDDYE